MPTEAGSLLAALARVQLQARKRWLAAGLTFIGGYVDAACAVALLHVFVANMTGNTVDIGMNAVQGKWALLLTRGSVIPFFVIGSIVSRLAIDAASRRRVGRIVGWLYAIEGALLLIFELLAAHVMVGTEVRAGAAMYVLLIALPAIAMGLQNAVLTHFGPLTIRTTHVTGTLTEFADKVAETIIGFRARTQGRSTRRWWAALRLVPRQPSLREGVLLISTWTTYVVGVALGVFLLQQWKAEAMAVPVAASGVLALVDFVWPLALAK